MHDSQWGVSGRVLRLGGSAYPLASISGVGAGQYRPEFSPLNVLICLFLVGALAMMGGVAMSVMALNGPLLRTVDREREISILLACAISGGVLLFACWFLYRAKRHAGGAITVTLNSGATINVILPTVADSIRVREEIISAIAAQDAPTVDARQVHIHQPPPTLK